MTARAFFALWRSGDRAGAAINGTKSTEPERRQHGLHHPIGVDALPAPLVRRAGAAAGAPRRAAQPARGILPHRQLRLAKQADDARRLAPVKAQQAELD